MLMTSRGIIVIEVLFIPVPWRDFDTVYRNPGKDTMKSTNLVTINPIHSEIQGTQIIRPIID